MEVKVTRRYRRRVENNEPELFLSSWVPWVQQQVEGVGGVDSIYISTFGVYAAVLENGQEVNVSKHEVRDLLRAAKWHDKKLYVLVGTPTMVHMKNREEVWGRTIQRILSTIERFPWVKWRTTDNRHTKYAVGMRHGRPVWAIVGGQNLTGSKNADAAVLLYDKGIVKRLHSEFKHAWHTAKSGALNKRTLGAAKSRTDRFVSEFADY